MNNEINEQRNKRMMKPTKECTQLPHETCQLRLGKQSGEVRLDTEWCQEEDD